MKLGFIADVHGHVEALWIALNVLAEHGVDSICFLGDAVGYLPGLGAVSIVQQTCSVCLRGNHEAMLLKPDDLPEYRDTIYQLRTTSREATASGLLETIGRWPVRESIAANSSRLLLVHGSPTEPLTGYVYPDTPLNQWNNLGYTHVVCAHTHRPFQRIISGVTWINCGSVGLPRDDGRYGSAAVLDLVTHQAQILRFDITRATERALRRVGHVADEVRVIYERRRTESMEGALVG
jgi:predicted phosphodiesterase